MSNFIKGINFVRKIKDKKNILSIVLFGSVATGDETRDSDIDIGIIYEKKKQTEMDAIDSIKDPQIQIAHLSLDDLKTEIPLRDALAGDGILLYGHPITITIQESSLKPKMLLIYNTSNLDQKIRSQLQRALYGGKSTSKYKHKTYESVFEGIVPKLNVKKLTRGVLFCDKKNSYALIRVFQNLNVQWKEISIWAYE